MLLIDICGNDIGEELTQQTLDRSVSSLSDLKGFLKGEFQKLVPN